MDGIEPQIENALLPSEGLCLVMGGIEHQIKNALATSIWLMFGDMGVLV
jgi:hypothetical protein